MSNWSLINKKAVVTGASKGIGFAIAKEFLAAGAEVLLVARNSEALDKARISLGHEYSEFKTLAADMSEEEGRQTLLKYLQEEWMELNILVNNVGTNIRKSTLDVSLEDFRHVFQTNVESAYALCQDLFPLLKHSGEGNIINIASIASKKTVSTSTAVYSMSKAALEQMTNYLAVEWGTYGIRVNSIHPWYINTPLVREILEDKEKRDKIIAHTPLGRIGFPEEVARVAAFLAMSVSSYVTGLNVPVDGGFSKVGMM